MPQSMFQRYGGVERVSELVFAFYDRVLASDGLGAYFASCDMRRLIEHQTKYISSVMGGPASYSDEQLRDLHAHLGITGAEFEEMLAHLRAAMVDRGFDAADTDAVMRRIAAMRRVVVST